MPDPNDKLPVDLDSLINQGKEKSKGGGHTKAAKAKARRNATQTGTAHLRFTANIFKPVK